MSDDSVSQTVEETDWLDVKSHSRLNWEPDRLLKTATVSAADTG